MHQFKKILISTLALLLVLAGCSGGDTNTGKVLRVAKDTDIRTLDTSVATDGLSFEVIEQFTDGLLDYDAAGTIIPRAAKELPTVSDDGLTYTFTLRDDIYWYTSDGEEYAPVTAHDFVFAWRRLVDPATASDYNYMITTAQIVNSEQVYSGDLPTTELGVEATDDKTLVVHLENAVPFFEQLMAFPAFNPLNEKFVTEKGDQYALSVENLLSNGPFIFTEWTKSSSWKLTKNEKYYDAANVNIDGIAYTLSADYQSSALQFDSGTIDVTKISASLVDQYKDTEAFKQVPIGYVWYIAFNLAKVEMLENTDLRLAIAYALDRSNITDNIMKDGSLPAEYIVPVGLASLNGKDFRDGIDPFLAYNVATAKEHIEKAKAALGVDKFEFELLIEDSEESKTNAAQIKADLEEIGVTVNITSIPKSERLERMQDATLDYELGLTRWGPDYSDPFTYLGDNFGLHKEQIIAWNNAEYNALIESVSPVGSLALQPNERWEAMKDAEEVFLNNAIVAPVWQSGEAMLINPKVTGIEIHVVGSTAYRNVKIAD
ncbi:hypothetical protein AOC36_00995 [Erysipelothrix larvae]|uniref:Solute-binding protein family 5 domain-containing protein n=1 Tax=Erysipelothrix larvae TaxID=1514105 RepID=A0A0X8GY78_9FIRM|nr:peptide ABC transporter substrate-binding protein [Erysipelothrix larvae]AMC92619.1 hypothetical protein AOC36_00995 [Erysipelothrix larvae]